MTNASGCTNFRHSTLTRHAQSQDHCEALQEEVMKKTFEKVGDLHYCMACYIRMFVCTCV
jgi:hypothetical protein